jgi:hypothetical protein
LGGVVFAGGVGVGVGGVVLAGGVGVGGVVGAGLGFTTTFGLGLLTGDLPSLTQ